MADQACGAEDPVGAEPLPGPRDAQMLKAAMHEAISTSPEAFLTTTSELKAKEAKDADYWEREIRSFTWVVLQRGAEFVGFAVARWPDGNADLNVDPAAARFIESVWIHPKLRGKRPVYLLTSSPGREKLAVSHAAGAICANFTGFA